MRKFVNHLGYSECCGSKLINNALEMESVYHYPLNVISNLVALNTSGSYISFSPVSVYFDTFDSRVKKRARPY